MHAINLFCKELSAEIISISLTLFKIMIPVIVVVKLLAMAGLITLIGEALSPFMTLLGLPETMGIVWATTLMTNIYAGLIIYVNLAASESMSIAQISVLGGLLLVSHSLPIESAVSKKVGVSVWTTVVIRIIGGFAFAWLLHLGYDFSGSFQEPAVLAWQPTVQTDGGLLAWGKQQVESLLMIQLIIIVLMFVLKVLKMIGIERLISLLLRPFLKLLGINPAASTITIVGFTLGLAFGGSLLIAEAKKGHVPARDIFIVILLLSLLHSLIEDTLLVLLLGADITGVLFFRVLFSFSLVAVISRIVPRDESSASARYLYRSVQESPVQKSTAQVS